MPEPSSEKTPLELIAALLAEHGVEFIVVGGQAENLMGSPRATYDTDICYRRTQRNLENLAAALRQLSPSLRGAPTVLPFRLDAASLALGPNFTLRTSLGDLDLLGYVEPIGGFEELLPGAEVCQLDDAKLQIIALDDHTSTAPRTASLLLSSSR